MQEALRLEAPAGPAAVERVATQNTEVDEKLPTWVSRMPDINASLNALCTGLLLTGWLLIRRKRRTAHRNVMIAAFAVSTAFLACYLTYHEALYHYTGLRGRPFAGSPVARFTYYSILIPHVLLAAVVPILALRVFYLAWKERWPQHRQLARITMPIWLFVSITGVVIYGMLYWF
jgi:protein SCO1